MGSLFFLSFSFSVKQILIELLPGDLAINSFSKKVFSYGFLGKNGQNIYQLQRWKQLMYLDRNWNTGPDHSL